MKVWLTAEEWFPVLEIHRQSDRWTMPTAYEIPDELVTAHEKAYKELQRTNNEIDVLRRQQDGVAR